MPGKKADWLKSMKGVKRRERLSPIVDIGSARVGRFVSRPGFWRGGAPVRSHLEQFIARLEGLPDAGSLIAEHLRAVRFAAVSRIRQRGPVERDEGAPAEIVEVGVGVRLDRGNVLDPVGRDGWRALVGDGAATGRSAISTASDRPRRSVANDRDAGDTTDLILRSEAKPRVSKDGPQGSAGSARAGAPFEAPSGCLSRARGEIAICEETTHAGFSYRSIFASRPERLRDLPSRPRGRG